MRMRIAVRVLLLNPKGEILLMRVDAPNWTHQDGQVGGSFWCTIGGGIEEGESLEAAAKREVFEETGRNDVRLGPPVWFGEGPMIIDGETILKKETYFVGWLETDDVSNAHWNDEEKELVKELRWWSISALAASTERIYPANIAKLLPDVVAGKARDGLVDVGQ
ncbi:MAG: NUDIX domain-containing protein [Rhodospirillaceae bacterium]|nr:NUDIX domain-containing protein [Rhodospirillaceae bacterium]